MLCAFSNKIVVVVVLNYMLCLKLFLLIWCMLWLSAHLYLEGVESLSGINGTEILYDFLMCILIHSFVNEFSAVRRPSVLNGILIVLHTNEYVKIYRRTDDSVTCKT